MKTTMKYILTALCVVVLATACRKEFDKVDGVSFDVSLSSNVFKVGEPVTFYFEGNPNLITFYSGEVGNDYAYKDQDRIVETDMFFSFNCSTSSGTAGAPNPGVVPISYSTDFAGEYTHEGMNAATWIDITDQFKLPNDTPISTLYSGDVEVSNLYVDPQKPIYFRFYFCCSAEEVAKGNGRTQWLFQSPQINGVAGDQTITLYDITTTGWTFLHSENWEAVSPKNWPDINASRVRFTSIFKPTETIESWCISGPIQKFESVNSGPDHGVAIKALADATLKSYQYSFKEPGEYNVAFVAANANVWDRSEKTVQLKVTIVEDEGSLTPPQPEDWK